MPVFALLVRCLLIVALCLDSGAVRWHAATVAAATATPAKNTAQKAVRHDVVRAGCEDKDLHKKDGAEHEDCDCTMGCTCACVFPTASNASTFEFLARHFLSLRPTIAVTPPSLRSTPSPVFRPPIS